MKLSLDIVYRAAQREFPSFSDLTIQANSRSQDSYPRSFRYLREERLSSVRMGVRGGGSYMLSGGHVGGRTVSQRIRSSS
jgi:hypothetical protein